MRKAIRALKPTILSALVLSAMAVSATTAQAEIGAHWDVDGGEYELLEYEIFPHVFVHLASEFDTQIEGSFATLLTKSGATKVEIVCTTIKIKNSSLQESGGAIGKIHFGGCITKLNGGSAAGVCKPHSPGALEGLIETNLLDALIVLHTTVFESKVDLLELLPQKSKFSVPFVTLILGKEGEENECSIGEKFDITGKAFLKEPWKGFLEEEIWHLVQEGPLSALLFGGNAATIDGSANMFLTGVNGGLPFSGIAA